MDNQLNNPYLNCKDPDFPFKHTDNSHHFNSRYVVEYTKPIDKMQVYFFEYTDPIFFESKHPQCWDNNPVSIS